MQEIKNEEVAFENNADTALGFSLQTFTRHILFCCKVITLPLSLEK